MKVLLVILFVFHVARADAISGKAQLGTLPNVVSAPTKQDLVETKNIKLYLNLMKRMYRAGLHELVPYDPLKQDEVGPIVINTPESNATLVLQNVVVEGMGRHDFSQVLLQAQSLENQNDKLLTFELTLPRLAFTADLNATVVMGHTTTITQLSFSGNSTGITNSGKLGLGRTLNPVNIELGAPSYEVNSYEIKTRIDDLAMEVILPNDEALLPSGDVIAAVVSAVVQQEINKILSGVTVAQVDAFLRTGTPDIDDNIVVDRYDIDGKSKSNLLPLSCGSPDDERETKNLNLLVELSRRIADVGLDVVPVFEPYKVEPVEVVISNKTEGSPTILLTNLVIQGLSSVAYGNLILRSCNESRVNVKRVTFENSFRGLQFEADVQLDVDSPVNVIAKVSGLAEGVLNNGSLGISIVNVNDDSSAIGREAYALTSFNLENRIKHLQLNFTSIKNGDEVPADLLDPDNIQNLADKFSYAFGKVTENQINSILSSLSPDQVDAFLLG